MYDEIIKKNCSSVDIEYGILNGNDTVVIIKTGKGATIYGENQQQPDLYVKLSEKIVTKFNYSVVVCSNPLNDNNENQLEKDIEFIKKYFNGKIIKRLIFIGFSSGANYGAWYGYNYFSKMILLNPILNLNFHKTNFCFANFKGEISLFVGENDLSAKYLPIINDREYLHKEIISGCGHHIMTEMFIEKVVKLLV